MKNKFLILATALALTASQAFAASIGDDNVDLGKPTSSSDKSITFKGPTSTKKLKGSQAGTLSYNGNALSVGDGANSANKTFTFDKGGSSPFFQYNFSTGAIDTGNLSLFNHTGNNLTVGDGADTNKVLKFNKGANSPEIRYNSTTSKLEFSNDASLYKAIGSGTGSGGDGGVNLLTNPSFEDGVSIDWSNTGGTFTQGTYTNGTESDAKYANFVASGSGQYFETALKSVPDSLGAGCMADLKYFGGSGNFKLQALDSSANVLSEIVLPNTTAWQKSQTLAYPCPAPGATMRARVISTGAGTIQGDLAYLGGNKNISQIAQARLAAEIKFVGTASCLLQYGSGGSYATATAAACPGPTIIDQRIGTCLTTDVDGPVVTCNNMPAGDYVLLYTLAAGVNAGSQGGLAVTDGSSTQGHISVPYAAAAIYGQTIIGKFSYSSSGSRTWTIVGRGFGNTTILYNNVADQNDINLKILYYPTTSETAVTNEQSSWFVDANLGGANVAVSTNSTYVEATDAGLNMVLNSGSASAEVPCSGTNPSTGLTCAAGSESMGVVFTPPYAGWFDVCAYGSANTAAATVSVISRLIETPNNAQTNLQTGQAAPETYSAAGAATTNQSSCSTFYFANTTKRTVRLMYEANGSGSFTADRSGTIGQRDWRFTVRPALQNIARPVLTGDQVTTPNAASPRVYALEFGGASRGTSCTSTPCTLHFNPGNWVTSVTRNSAGNYTVNIPSTTFGSGAYTCTCSTAATSAGCQIFGGTPGATSFNVFGASGADNSLALMCLGLKP
jgi:hypothetical protein